ncbi:uncharacterized protein AB675_11100 [Cyphellophora attinorum]|uniref:Cyclase n=1 Tax=Cyphellophora attinorum TaxID=1664694 RepID=A0A0N0NIG0_9EURO|nr:uncharacterized protein AB675_11100 [Phialophora attinorum]KPI35791.1 hypothetical protein AB675_11100 [Phialophora attinorum]
MPSTTSPTANGDAALNSGTIIKPTNVNGTTTSSNKTNNTMQRPYPAFKDLPLTRPGPRGNAWSLWGPDDQLGSLNHLTPSTVAHAARTQILTGERVSLNWTLQGATFPRFQHPRKNLEIRAENKFKARGVHAFDDEWAFNTQCSSQWDGCRHYAYQEEGMYYMGRKAEEFEAGKEANGIQHMSRKGIAGRGLLVDWWRWKQGKGEGDGVDAYSSYAIPWEELIAAAESQGTPLGEMQAGDLLIVRSGYLAQYETMANERREELDKLYQHTKPDNIGVGACPEILEFLWEKKIAAVAGDARSFERWPCPPEEKEWHLHQWLLAGWGMPIGELWDLEALSEECARQKRWTFFLTSAPMNVPGGVASPPNALAFF